MVYCKSIGLAKLFRKPIQWQLPAFPKVHVRKTCHTLSNFLNPDLRIPPQVQAGGDVAVGEHLPTARSFTDIENGQISKAGGAALARISTSGSLSPLQVPRPRPSAAKQPPAAGHRAFLQPSNPQLPPHSGHLTPWSGHCILARQTLPFLPLVSRWNKLVETYVCQLAQYWQLLKLP